MKQMALRLLHCCVFVILTFSLVRATRLAPIYYPFEDHTAHLTKRSSQEAIYHEYLILTVADLSQQNQTEFRMFLYQLLQPTPYPLTSHRIHKWGNRRSYSACITLEMAEKIRLRSEVQWIEGDGPVSAENGLARNYVMHFTMSTQRTMQQNEIRSRLESNNTLTSTITQQNAPWPLARITHKGIPYPLTFSYDAIAGKDVDVYVVDSGIRTTHEEFGGRAVMGYNAVPTEPSEDLAGHGTHVAALAGGQTFGVAKQVQLIGVKVLDQYAQGNWTQVQAGLSWVYQRATRMKRPAVVNFSIGGRLSPTINLLLAQLVEANILVVGAAGNIGQDACQYTPGAVSQVLIVGASDEMDSYLDAPPANYGSCVDVVAPGGEIQSAWRTSDTATRYQSGTSMAAPLVTGMLALWQSISHKTDNSTLTMNQVMERLHDKGIRNAVSNVPDSLTPNVLIYMGPD